MASIRRTLSPYHHNGGAGPFSAQSPTHKPLPNGKSQPSPPSLSAALRRLLAGASLLQYSRRWHRSIFGYFMFFSIGFLLGMLPLSHVDDAPSVRDFSFGRKLDGVVVNSVELGAARERLESNDRKSENIVVNSVELGVKREGLELNRQKQESTVVNSVELRVERERIEVNHRKQLIIVTPTYNRGLQAYFFNRLGQVLRLVPPPLLWVVVEMNEASAETAEVLRKTGVMYRHLVCMKNLTDVKDRGVHQRNTALEHIERHKLDGIVYFADDDNVYSLELFDSLREIRQFGTWPVAMLAQSKNKAILEGPVCNGSKVIGWHTNEKSKRLRRFHVDMSGFAFNSTILWDPKRWRHPTSNPIRQLDTVKEGFQETTFIEQVVEDGYQIEGSGPSCSRIMNWHLHLEASKFVYPRGWLLQKNLDVVLPIV